MKNEEENKLITIALAQAGGDRAHAAKALGMSIRTLQRKIKIRMEGGDLIAVDFLKRLVNLARTYGHQGDYVCVRDFVRWCHEEYDEQPSTDEELEPFPCEDDCRPD